MTTFPHFRFVEKLRKSFSNDSIFVGIAIGGSYIDNSLDEYSDLDVHLVVDAGYEGLDFEEKKAYLATVGTPLCCYSNGHDARVVVCLYDYNPFILHVDWKWQSLKEFEDRVENPVVLFEKDFLLTTVMHKTGFSYPLPEIDKQESRFWSWMHYVFSKIGRGEILEASDYLSEIRSCCIGPLLLHKNGMSPRRMRRAEWLPAAEWKILEASIQQGLSASACFGAAMGMIKLYQYVRESYIGSGFQPLKDAEAACLRYAAYIEAKLSK